MNTYECSLYVLSLVVNEKVTNVIRPFSVNRSTEIRSRHPFPFPRDDKNYSETRLSRERADVNNINSVLSCVIFFHRFCSPFLLLFSCYYICIQLISYFSPLVRDLRSTESHIKCERTFTVSPRHPFVLLISCILYCALSSTRRYSRRVATRRRRGRTDRKKRDRRYINATGRDRREIINSSVSSSFLALPKSRIVSRVARVATLSLRYNIRALFRSVSASPARGSALALAGIQ